MAAELSEPRPFKKRLRLTKLQQLKVCDHHRNNPQLSYRELAGWVQAEFKLKTTPHKSLVARALKSEKSPRRLTPDCLGRRKTRPAFQLLLDQCVLEFVAMSEELQLALSGEMIIGQAKMLARRLDIPPTEQPHYGWSWLRHLQERYGIKWRRSYGESGAADMEAAASEIERLRSIISTYPLSNVYNMDETSFFFNSVPRGSLCLHEAPALKQDKSRITLAVCSNATGGDKLPLLFLGKSVKPRWIGDKPADVHYIPTKKAWMTTDAFQAWLLDFDDEMRAQGRKVLLLVDNASSHDDEGIRLTHVRIERLPPNTTSKVQPMDQGIIYSNVPQYGTPDIYRMCQFIIYYKPHSMLIRELDHDLSQRAVLRKKMHSALEKINDGFDGNPYKVGMLQAITWCAEAWNELPTRTIEHCWLHSGLISKADLNFILN